MCMVTSVFSFVVCFYVCVHVFLLIFWLMFFCGFFNILASNIRLSQRHLLFVIVAVFWLFLILFLKCF